MITDLILCELEYPPLITKGGELAIDDFDNNIINIYGGFVELNNAGKVRTYSGTINFIIGDYTIYESIVYRSVAVNIDTGYNTNNTPASDSTFWTRVSSGELIGVINANASGITAKAGGGQASATVLNFEYHRIDIIATANDSTKCNPAKRGDSIMIFNNATNTLNHFPAIGETIIGFAANAPLPINANQIVRLFCFVDGFWTIVSNSSSDNSNALTGYDENALTGAITSPYIITKKSTCIIGTNGGVHLYAPAALPGREFWVQAKVGISPGEAFHLDANGTDTFEQQDIGTPFIIGEQEFWVFYCTKTGNWRVK